MPSELNANSVPTSVNVVISAQYIKDFSFESPNAPQIFAPSSAAPDIQMGVNILTRVVGENTYEVVLATKMDVHLEGKTAFIVELAYAGVFTVSALPEPQLNLFLLIECPRILFPFSRNIMMTTVREGGFPQVMINPIDFAELYANNQGQQASLKTGAA